MTQEYFGHERIVSVLTEGIPPVSLFYGPASVGKWELAEWTRSYHGVLPGDILRIKRLTQDNARFVAQFAARAPSGEFKLCIIRLEKATTTALNTLLKTLEEGTQTRFILISSAPTIPTIESRAEVFSFGLLTEGQISQIVQHTKSLRAEIADERARKASGTVQTALKAPLRQDEKTLVLRALEAVVSKDHKTLETLATRWEETHTELLISWCYEILTGRWKVFLADETNIRGTSIPLRILMALKDDLRPRLVVRSALMGLAQN